VFYSSIHQREKNELDSIISEYLIKTVK
jgi:hypothetical protein